MIPLVTTGLTSPRLARFDPRARVCAAFLLTCVAAVLETGLAIAVAFGLAALLCLYAGLTWSQLRTRLGMLNLLLVILLVTLPWSVPGSPIGRIAGWSYTREGVQMAVWIMLKANAIVLFLSALLGTLDTATLAHALEHLRLPRKLVHLLIFTVRYMDLLHAEATRAWRAARMRAFQPGMNRHTYHTVAAWIGSVMVRGLDRSDRVLAAMKARGFQGRFYLFHHFHFAPRDLFFTMAVLGMVTTLACLEWM